MTPQHRIAIVPAERRTHREQGFGPQVVSTTPGADPEPMAVPCQLGGTEGAALRHERMRRCLDACVSRGASDLLLSAGEPPIYRIHGDLAPDGSEARLAVEELKDMIESLLRTDQISRLRQDGALDFSLTLNDEARFRVNCFFQRGRLGGAFRRIPSNPPRLGDLGLGDAVRELTSSRQGLVLVTGPTGCGKSTTLAAFIDAINRSRSEHVVTIEDPIEYVHANRMCIIEQREIGSDTPSFAMALKHVLRQDPNVIMIGEMRDLETIATAITAAETGHLVLATLHTNDCTQTIDRIVDVFPPAQQWQIRSQLAVCLLAVLNQRLVPRADRPGRALASELMLPNTAIRALIREGKTHQIYSLIETGTRSGMHTMDQDLARLVRDGRISSEMARSLAVNPRNIEGTGISMRRDL